MKRGLLVLVLLGFSLPAQGQTIQGQTMDEVVVTGDPVRLLQSGASDAAFGLDKPLLETPRAVTVVSDTTIARYGVDGLDSLTALTPSAYTSSYYGVEGAVSLRGTLAENYFKGFKRAENRGTYSTPLGNAAAIEILRGPPSPIYGAGKVGGLVNFIPKTQKADDAFGGEASVTYGAYSKRMLTGQIGAPVSIGTASGGLHAYAELDDSYSFYRGLHPSHQMLEVSGDLVVGDWSLSADYLYYRSAGDVQTPGWNRLTQGLVDNGTYVTGHNISLKDADGNGRLTLNELGGNPYFFDPAFTPLACIACTDAAHRLDTGIGTTTLDRRSIYVARGVDFSDTTTHTGLLEAVKMLDAGESLRLQLFVDTLQNDRFVSYGFPGSYRTQIYEARLRYDFARDFGALKTQTVTGVSFRHAHAIGKESYNSGVIALDRRDISAGAAANDILDSPFNRDAPGTVGLGWENDVRSNLTNAGAFVTTDLTYDAFDLLLGGRYDTYNVRSVDKGVLAYEAPSGRGNAGRFTWSASFSYKTDFGLVPYVTTAKSAAVEIGQAGQVMTSLLTSRSWLSNSFLNEAGIKFSLLDDTLQGGVNWYLQNRTQLSQGAGVTSVQGTRAEGEELELRYVASRNFSITLAGGLQHTTIKGPDHSFAYLPARSYGISPQDGFGGSYITYDFSTLPGRGGDYENTLLPHAVISPYVTWTSDRQDWGQDKYQYGATLGGTYVGKTRQTVPGGITFPSYVTVNASAFAQWDVWEVDANVNNLSDARYFTPGADTYANLSALPGLGRTWKVTLKRLF